MSNNINEEDTNKNAFSNIEQNIYENNIKLISKELEKDEKESKEILHRISDKNNNLNIININYEQKNLKKPNEKVNNSSIELKDKIFKVNYRNIHDGDAPDNIKQSIVTNFINFFIIFINYIVGKKLNTDDKIFHISYQLKSKIKIEDIIELTVKELLLFEPQKKTKNNEGDNKIENKENIDNINQFNKINKRIGTSLNKLFDTPVINLFKDIYAKNDFENQNEKIIDLKIYGVDGIQFILNDNIPTYEKLKESNKDNKRKINIMDEIVNQKIINHKKVMFKIKKKE
jgi:hypothetical protein